MNKEEFYIGQIFEEKYPPEASYWCDRNSAYIIVLDPIEKTVSEEYELFNEKTEKYETHSRIVKKTINRFQIKEIPVPTDEELQEDVRDLRNHYLETYIDPVVSNPFRWADMNKDDQQDYIDYRLYLLNFTKEKKWWLKKPLTMPEWLDKKEKKEDESDMDNITIVRE